MYINADYITLDSKQQKLTYMYNYISVHVKPPTHKHVITLYELKLKKKNITNTLLKGLIYFIYLMCFYINRNLHG